MSCQLKDDILLSISHLSLQLMNTETSLVPRLSTAKRREGPHILVMVKR